MREAAATDEILDDGLEVVLLDGAALGDGPLLQHGGQLEMRDRCGSDAAVQGVGQRLRWWMGWRGGGLGCRGEASEQADARREEAVHRGAGGGGRGFEGKETGLRNGLSTEWGLI